MTGVTVRTGPIAAELEAPLVRKYRADVVPCSGYAFLKTTRRVLARFIKPFWHRTLQKRMLGDPTPRKVGKVFSDLFAIRGRWSSVYSEKRKAANKLVTYKVAKNSMPCCKTQS